MKEGVSSGKFAAALVATLVCASGVAARATLIEPPVLRGRVAKGELPPLARRIPAQPSFVDLAAEGKRPGRYGGELRLLMGKQKDTRMMMVYGYARLVVQRPDLSYAPDILARYEVREGRAFTFYLRKGHKWSDGHPFTAEDFRYYWEDIANNRELSPTGLPRALLVDGAPPRFEVIDETTVRYVWPRPNPNFIPWLAHPRPIAIYRPAHYLKQFHIRYGDRRKIARLVKAEHKRNWAQLHISRDRYYRMDNPDRPTLQPWVNTVRPPSDRFVFERNPYYHRIDSEGRQLPYIDRVVLRLGATSMVAARTGTGEADLQARYLRFDDYTFLKANERRYGYRVRLWRKARGAQIALYPNLNAADPVWRRVLRDVRFRRALSLAIDRHEINQVIFYGLARESNNTVLAESPLFRPEYRTAWARFDLARANALLDEMGLTARDEKGRRLLPDGRPMVLTVDTAGESTEQNDVLELIRDTWRRIGIALLIRSAQREVFRSRIFAGQTIMSVWSGISNGIPSAEMSPEELTPSNRYQFQWPKWGQYIESGGRAGEPPDLPAVRRLVELARAWPRAATLAEKRRIWHQILRIHADRVFTIGIVNATLQPVVVNVRLRNVPAEGFYNWYPGAYFGIYRPDTFWFAEQ